MDKTKFENQIDTLSFATEEELKQMWIDEGKDPNEKLIPIEVSEKFKELYPENSKDTCSGIFQIIQNSNKELKLTNSLNFASNSLACEWAYVIDLDKNTFEVYKGYNKEVLAANERFYSVQEPYVGLNASFYPVKHIISFDLDDLPNEEEFLGSFEN